MGKGISVIICCYNSALRLEQTLGYLSQQEIFESFNAEIIIVDNNSTDATEDMANKLWQRYHSPYPLKVIQEAKIGLAFARKAGVFAAAYEYLIFCDDDNWLHPNYLSKVNAYFDSDPLLGAIGGLGEPVFETQKPFWFDDFYHGYAVGKQAHEGGYLNSVYGAGMALRRSAYLNDSFLSMPLLLSDRKGANLSAGGDAEICLRIRLLGFKVLYSEALLFKHFIPANRLTWPYLLKLHRGFSHAVVPLEAYERILTGEKFANSFWLRRVILYYGRVIKYGIKFLPQVIGNREGKREIISLSDWFICGTEYLKCNFRAKKMYNSLLSLKAL